MSKAIYMAHSAGVERVVRTMIQLIREGVLVADFERRREMARALRKDKGDSSDSNAG